MSRPGLRPPREVLHYYDVYPEEDRLQQGAFRLEFERTKDMLSSVLSVHALPR